MENLKKDTKELPNPNLLAIGVVLIFSLITVLLIVLGIVPLD